MSSVYSNYIKRMRMCANGNCKGCTYAYEGLTNTEECKEDLLHDAAEQLEDADMCNARLVKKCKEMEKRIAELMPKEGEWIEANTRPRSAQFYCSVCNRTCYDIQPTRDKAWTKRCRYNYCPNCGARMQTVTDCHASGECER